MRLQKAFLAYEIDLKAENRSPDTIRWYHHKLGYFAEWLAREHGIADVEALTGEYAKGFLLYVQGLRQNAAGSRPFSRGRPAGLTVHGYARAIRAFCRWLARNGYVDKSPFDGIRMPKVERPVVQAFTADDVRHMLKAARSRRHGERDYTILLLLYDSAIRAGELVKLTLEDVDFDGGWLRVNGKGGKQRMVPLGQTARRALWRYVENGPTSAHCASGPRGVLERASRASHHLRALAHRARRGGGRRCQRQAPVASHHAPRGGRRLPAQRWRCLRPPEAPGP